MKQIVAGEYAWVWDSNKESKRKRIWLGDFNGYHLVVHGAYEEYFKNGENYDTATYRYAEPIEDEPEYYYKWKKATQKSISISSPITDEHAEKHEYKEEGWTRIESSKCTFEECEG